MKNLALGVAGIIFLAVSAGHFARFYKAWHVAVAEYNFPLQWSLYAGIISLILAIWMFVAAGR